MRVRLAAKCAAEWAGQLARAIVGAGAEPPVNQQVFAFCNHSRTRL